MTTEANARNLEVISEDGNNDVATDEKPSDSKEQKPSTEPEMLTKEQAEKLANERHSKLDKRIAELTKATEKQQKAVRDAEERAMKAQQAYEDSMKRIEEAERKSLGDSPDAVKLFEAQVKHRREVAEHERKVAEFQSEKAKYEEDIAEAKQYKITKAADAIAEEYGVDASLLVSLTDGTSEKMERLAKSLPKKGTDETVVRKQQKPDSGKRSSGYGNLTNEQLEKLPMDKYQEMVEARKKK
jgi:membrane protein involved in colicin uptake